MVIVIRIDRGYTTATDAAAQLAQGACASAGPHAFRRRVQCSKQCTRATVDIILFLRRHVSSIPFTRYPSSSFSTPLRPQKKKLVKLPEKIKIENRHLVKCTRRVRKKTHQNSSPSRVGETRKHIRNVFLSRGERRVSLIVTLLL